MHKFKVTDLKKNEFDSWMTIISDALVIPDKFLKYIAGMIVKPDWSEMRALRDGSRLIGGLKYWRWGHFFAGRSVPAAGIAFVGILPEYRRVGAASYMMAETVRELFRKGIALSTLYPANIPLYRKAGYECAIEHNGIEVQLDKIRIRNMKCEMAAYTGKGYKAFSDLYREFASSTNGNIDRIPLRWKPVLDPYWYGKTSKYLIKNGKKVEGYAFITIGEEDKPLRLTDYSVLTRDATERLLTFLADHSSILEKGRWVGSSHDILTQLLPERAFQIYDREYCMVRIVSVKHALEARGYPSGINGEVHFEIDDEIVSQNCGRWVLNVRDGKGKIKKGGEGRIKIDIRSLAQMYTGIMSSAELKICGTVDGADDDLNLAATVFSGPRPWIRDGF